MDPRISEILMQGRFLFTTRALDWTRCTLTSHIIMFVWLSPIGRAPASAGVPSNRCSRFSQLELA